MSIKRIFIVISAIFAVSAVFADNSSVTSKKYVDDLMSGYQGKLPGSGANTLMIYDDSEDGIGEKSIAATLGNSASATSVPTVGAVKTGLDGKQDTITGTAGYVMTGTGNAGEVGERPIYGTSENYAHALVTAETVNTGVVNAVNNSLIRVDENGAPSDSGTLWEINTSLFALSTQPLPTSYTRLEYIESNGTQYIDTGIKTSLDTELEAKINFSAVSAQMLWASNSGSSSDRITAYFASNGTCRFGNIAKEASLVSGISAGTDYVIKQNKNGIYRDGTAVLSYSASGDFESDTSMYIGTARGTSAAGFSGLLKTAIIRKNGVVVFNGVPAKNSSNVVGMYDTITGRFFPDAAGGNFTAGPSCISPNLFDTSTLAFANVELQPDNTYYATNKMSASKVLWENTSQITGPFTLRWAYKQDASDRQGFRFKFKYTDGTSESIYITPATSWTTKTAISNTGKTLESVLSDYGSVVTGYLKDIQIEPGSTATQYRPYGENICD